MNILALTSVYPQPDDGDDVVTPTVQYFCNKWAEAGHCVFVIHSNSRFPALAYTVPVGIRQKLSSKLGFNFPTESSRKPKMRVENGIKIYRLPMTKIVPHKRFRKNQIKVQTGKIEEILSAERFVPDLIVSHWLNPQLDLILTLKKKYNVKTSLVFHNDCTLKNVEIYDLKNTITQIDAVGCRNMTYAKEVKDRLGLSRMPFICYSGIPDEKAEEQIMTIENLPITPKHDYIYAGRLVQYKNVDVIVKALSRTFPNGGFKLHVIGEGAEREILERMTKKFGITDQVIFYGSMSRDKVFETMKKCNCFIMVSDNETFGMVYIEAMLAGCITVASKKGGVDGVIIDGVNGFLSEQGSVDDLVLTLARIDSLSREETVELKKKAIRTAYEYRDSKVSEDYLSDVLNWR